MSARFCQTWVLAPTCAVARSEQPKARGRSQPERTRLYVRIGDDRERRDAKLIATALGTKTVPPPAGRTPILPGTCGGAAVRARIGPLKRKAESERFAVLFTRLPDLTSPFIDRPEVCVHLRKVRKRHLDLPKLVHRVVEHRKLEVHSSEVEGQHLILGRSG